MFKGSCVALVSPMTNNGEIDEKALFELVEWHITEGTSAIVVAGSTGESATLTAKEQAEMLALICKTAKRRIPIIAGTGTNSTQTTIERTQTAKEIGADACLVVTPYYNRPTQEGLISHYTALTKATNIPILLYNVPSRTACDLLPETVGTLSKIPSIIGIKEATGNLQRLKDLTEACEKGFAFYSGDDPTALDFILKGGHGVISITSNVAPKRMQEMCNLALMNERSKAHAIDETLQQLHRMLIAEPNPIPVKWAMQKMGKMAGHLRLPLTIFSVQHHKNMISALHTAGLTDI
ncbi:MAG: 4-hydroxy-tetrahydrodipicolinate synthase [Candidatus Berkiellales bacterium]